MKKFPIDPRLLEKAEQIIKGKCAEMDERVADLGREIMEDQKTWLDAQMKDLLPPHLYEAGKRQENLEEIAAYVKKHGIAIVYVPDTLRVRIMLRGKPHAEFVPQLMVDGVPVNRTPEKPSNN